MTNEEYHKHDETNRLIAEFMGLETVVRHPRTQEWTQARFDFHHSWDCLMQVIKEISNRVKEFDAFHTSDWKEVFDTNLLNTSIETEYNACVDFIQWYNQNK